MNYLLLITIISVSLGVRLSSTAPRMFVRSTATTVPQKAIVERLPSQTMKEAILRSEFPDIIMRIWGLETSFGKNPSLTCIAKGQTNELGFGIHERGHMCFDSYDEQVEAVTAWLKKYLPKYKIAATMCLYNKGVTITDCPYWENYKRIL
jgi:hypothetical protein